MKMRDRAVGLAARMGVWCLRLGVLYLPRRFNELVFRGLARLIYAATGDPQAATPVADVAAVFAAGPPCFCAFEKIFRNMEPEFIAGVARCLARRSPYGAA